MLDLLITNTALPDGRTGMFIAVQSGKITAVTKGPITGVLARKAAYPQALMKPYRKGER